MNTKQVKYVKILADGTKIEGERDCLNEHFLEILVNDKRMYRLVCTRDNIKELVYGRLFTDRLIKDRQDVEMFFTCKEENQATVLINPDLFKKNEEKQKEEPPLFKTEGSCCSLNRAFLDEEGRRPLKRIRPVALVPEKVFALSQLFKEETGLHSRTGAVHQCILLYEDQEGRQCHASFEDIGRHNAVDKAAGFLLLNDLEVEKTMLFTSGRVPVDMILKVVAAKIPVIVSKSVPSVEAIELAETYGVTLVARAWPDSFECYTGFDKPEKM